MSNSFGAGEADTDTVNPPITQEVIQPRLAIRVSHPGPQSPPTSVPYLMPPVSSRHGSMERSADPITLTPLGGLMPGPYAVPPAVMAGHVGAFPVSEGEFGQGIADSFPEGCPIPIR